MRQNLTSMSLSGHRGSVPFGTLLDPRYVMRARSCPRTLFAIRGGSGEGSQNAPEVVVGALWARARPTPSAASAISG
jgi:hypothetical protein